MPCNLRLSKSVSKPVNSLRRMGHKPSMMLALMGLLLGTMPLFAQAGLPIDWSSKHVIYTPAKTLAEWEAVRRDPRALHQEMMRNKRLGTPFASEIVRSASEPSISGLSSSRGVGAAGLKKSPFKVDWAVSLANGAVAPDMSPAKYDFITNNAPSCSDWVVYGLNVASSATQASLVAFNNLYGTTNGCTANPQAIFAYETVGPVITSPTISYGDSGAQVAYVDNESGKATLVVLKYGTGTGNGTSAASPVALPGTGTKVSLTYSTTTNSNSPVYIDYVSDTAYVGDDGGKLYKISPVFGGGTPVTVKTATLAGTLAGPVLDQLHGVVLVGSSNGDLYAVNSSTFAALTGSPLAVGTGGTNGGVVDPPVIVTGTTTTYAFVTTGCTSSSVGELYEASVTGTALAKVASPNISQSHNSCATNNLHAPALDDAVYNGTAGYLYVCGTVIKTNSTSGTAEAPDLYSFSFNPSSGALGGSATSTVSASGTASDECSPLTYFTSNSTSRIFLGVGTAGAASSINGSAVTTAGAIGALTGVTTPDGLGGTSGIVVDNSSATASLANVYFSGLTAGNVTGGSCLSFTVSGSSSGTTVTLTGTGFNFAVGNPIVVSGFTGTRAVFNGTFVVASTTGTTSLTYTDSAASGTITSGTGGTASWGTCGFQLTQTTL